MIFVGFVNNEKQEDVALNILNDIEKVIIRRLPLHKDDGLLVELNEIAERYGYAHENKVAM